MMGTQAPEFDDDFMATMLGDFLDESECYLTNLNEKLMVLEEAVSAAGSDAAVDVDIELLNEMFRDAHSLKGLSAMLQLTDINRLTHRIENVFDAARSGELAMTSETVDVLFRSLDRLVAMVEGLRDPGSEPVEYETVVGQIQVLLDTAGVLKEQKSNSAVSEMLSELRDEAGTSAQAAKNGDLPTSANSGNQHDQLFDPFEGVRDDENIADNYLAIFIDESNESLEAVTDLLVGDAPNRVESLLVIWHRIKGAAAAIGLHRLAKMAHLAEDHLQELRDQGRDLCAESVDALLAVADAARQFTTALRAGESCDPFHEAYRALLQTHDAIANANTDAPSSSPVRSDSAPAAGLNDEERSQLLDGFPGGASVIVGAFEIDDDVALPGVKAEVIVQRLTAHGGVARTIPEKDALATAVSLPRLVFALLKPEDKKTADVIDSLSVNGTRLVDWTECTVPAETTPREQPSSDNSRPQAGQPAARTAPQGTARQGQSAARGNSAPAAKTPANQRATETLRVDIERLDQLMNLAGQLVINKARISQIGERLKDVSVTKQLSHSIASISLLLERALVDRSTSGNEDSAATELQFMRDHVRNVQRDLAAVQAEINRMSQARNLVGELTEAVHQLERVSDGIQRSVMDTRMVPIGPLFGRFKRVIRDITKNNGKRIRLVIRGDNTELDKRMIDELGDPLIHLVRNAADHGIESPEERQALNKPPEGTVTLDAFHRGNRIIVEVCDDGKGLSPDKLRTKAIEKGIISQAEAERLTDQQALQLIWEPGFSTAEKITEVSGRGMGMDIVRSKIEQINGMVEIDSRPGQGTRISIQLPLTMAILPSLLAVIGDVVYALPMESVSEIVKVSPSDVSTVHEQEVASVRGRLISVVELSTVLEFQNASRANAGQHGDRTLVIVNADGCELGLRVDRLIGEEDIVIKSVAENYRNVKGIAGASILGNGRVSLILDIAAMIDAARSTRTLDHSLDTPAKPESAAVGA